MTISGSAAQQMIEGVQWTSIIKEKNTVRSIPLFNDDQWRVVCALEQAGKAGKIVPMAGTRLQHWFPDMCDGLRGVGNSADPVQQTLARGLAQHFFKQTLPLALVKVDGHAKHLALVIADDDTAIGVPGGRLVQVVSWSRALGYLDRGQGSTLIDMAENIVACGKAQASITIHEEEAALKTDIARHLHLAWPEALDRSALDADTIALVTSFLGEQRGQFAIFRDVAMSRIIDLVPGEVVDRDMRKVFDTSDVDVVIHGRPPCNIPLLAIEYDGDKHRTDQKKMANDRAKDALLGCAGIALLRIGTDRASAKRMHETQQKRHWRLAPMLDIARVILEHRLVEHTRAAKDRARMAHVIVETSSIARALYDKALTELNPTQQGHALGVRQLARTDEHILLDAGRTWEDLEEESSHGFSAQLGNYGVDPTWVSDVAICSTSCGYVGRARLKFDDGGAVRSIETVAVSLNAPSLQAETIARLVKMQVYAELAYQAFRLVAAVR